MRKICTRCKAEKDEEEFRWRVRHGPKARRGSWCKACCAEEAKRYNLQHKEQTAERIKNSLERHAAKCRTQTNYVTRSKSNLRGYLQIAANAKISHCRRKGIPCDITAFDLLAIYSQQGGLCALTGVPLVWGPYELMRDTLSIDRIHPYGGYTKHNVRLVTFQANHAKGPHSDEELIEFARRVLRTEEQRLAREAPGPKPVLENVIRPDTDDQCGPMLFRVPDSAGAIQAGDKIFRRFRCDICVQKDGGGWFIEEAWVVEVPFEYRGPMLVRGFYPVYRPRSPKRPEEIVPVRLNVARKKAMG